MYLGRVVSVNKNDGSAPLLFTTTNALISDWCYSLLLVRQEHLADDNLAVGLRCVEKILSTLRLGQYIK